MGTKTVGLIAKEQQIKEAIQKDMETMKREYRKQYIVYYSLLYGFLIVISELVRMALPVTMTIFVVFLFSLLYTAFASMAVKGLAVELGVKYSGSEHIGYFDTYDKYTIESRTRITIARWLLEKEVFFHFMVYLITYSLLVGLQLFTGGN